MLKTACVIGILYLGVIFSSCRNEDFNIGGYLVDPHTSVVMVDTVTIRVSNLVATDSVITSNKSVGFSGYYNDPQIGAMQAQTYIEFSKTTDSEGDKYAKFDSVTLVLRPNARYYGDTVQYAAFKVSKLTKPIEKDVNGYLYSTSTVPVGEQLADTAIKVKVSKKKEVEIKLPSSFGEWLFKGIVRDEIAFNSDNYLKTFPGLSVSPGVGSACVYGLSVNDTTCMIRIYYHVNSTYREDKKMTFKANPGNSFYHLNDNKAQVPPYNSKSNPVPSSLTENKGILMSGTSMYARLEFPHLNNLLSLGQIVKIQKAILYIRPIHHSFDTVPLPPKLNLYEFDPTSNIPIGAILTPAAGSNSKAQDGGLPTNYRELMSPAFPQYAFDITSFISSQMGKVGYAKWALSLIIPETVTNNNITEVTMERLVFGNQKYWYKSVNQSKDNQVRLEVTYVAYND